MTASAPTVDSYPQLSTHTRPAGRRETTTIKARGELPKHPTVQVTAEDKARFQDAAERAGLTLIDAFTLAVNLLETRIADERAETAAERIARLSSLGR